jgi:hypothetical protein
MFGGRVFQQTVGIPMGTNCAHILAELFLYSYERDFIQGLSKKNEKKLERSYNFTFSYIYDILSLNNSRLGDFVDRIYPIAFEIKDTTDTEVLCRCCWNVATYKWKVHNGKIEIISFVVNFRS